MFNLIAAACIFFAGLVTNCDTRIARFYSCAVELPAAHVQIVKNWVIKPGESGKALWGENTRTIQLGENATCEVFDHEIGHLVQIEYGFPGRYDESKREQFANAYKRAFAP